MTAPVFFDPTGRRRRWAQFSVGTLTTIVLVAALAFAATLLAMPKARELALPFSRMHAGTLKVGQPHGPASWLPRFISRKPTVATHTPLTIGFYVPWDDASASSLRHHIAALDWVVPAIVKVTGTSNQLQVQPDRVFDRIMASTRHAPKVLPMIQNAIDNQWDGAGTAKMLADPAARTALAQRLVAFATQRHDAGLVIDYEGLPDTAIDQYVRFLGAIHARMPKGMTLALTVPAENPAWRPSRFARVADRIILMAYDQHWEGGTAGPIAPQGWFAAQVENALRSVGRDRLIVAIGSYAYDWHDGKADSLSVEEAWLAAHDSGTPVTFDPASGNAGFAYDDGNAHHEVWMLDAATSWNQLQALRQLGVDNVALWRLGSEDPGIWPDFTGFRSGARPDLAQLTSPGNVDVEGKGELLRIAAVPTTGRRTTLFDSRNMIRDERYAVLPTPYVVQRTGGAQPRSIALTFDDGPDPTWTPRILTELEAAHVPATFFVVGENALLNPGLLNRIVRDGSEIGNHSYTHPNLALAGDRVARLELNATQRLVEAYTGRAMRLFRAPYFGDAEPTTPDELGPALIAQELGYTEVGLHVDPNDWQRPGVDAIVNQVITQVEHPAPSESANIVLLHDGGGDRSQTVAALPRVIAALKARGYSFVTASELGGVSPAQAMPVVDGADLLAVRTDVAIFVALAGLSALLGWIFYLAITLGIVRAISMTALAIVQSRRRPTPPVHQPSVSVIIPAYNEERVIEASVRRVLASDYPGLSVIIADDGSKDATSAVVQAAFGADPRVTLLTLVNGGKAPALNRALLQATGEIIIALDADTQFEPETITRLARWFADPAIGAVAGDARVGNRNSIVTRWQAVEYITAQNLERRALAGFGAMTVVPGAVGAWRRAALDMVGGYPEDTLAEDQDLTIAIQRAGWRVTYDPEAVAWTEAPESFRALAKQRYRWAFGTLQCLWKHRAILRERRPRGLAFLGLPQAWLFQIGFAAISPLIDLALVLSIVGTALRVWQHGLAQTSGDVSMMGVYWLAFTAIDVACGWFAYRLDGNRARYPAVLLVAQRFVYRQIMYWVVVRAISSAIGGWMVGWGKLERTGSVTANQPALTTVEAG
jgi:cellulose synthase/poly-beta-1,6-N-acetylglucosamine synthase-like glycosyltransferase/peptidoglycan/xylan/chitin deacetylase (PgdA/CDA1 family)/spore germination protein YaaH